MALVLGYAKKSKNPASHVPVPGTIHVSNSNSFGI
jgi:hypothetical protein